MLLNCSNSFFVGFPVFVYSRLPLGFPFLVTETYLYAVVFTFLLLEGQRVRSKYVFYISVAILFFLLNIAAGKLTRFNFPNEFPRQLFSLTVPCEKGTVLAGTGLIELHIPEGRELGTIFSGGAGFEFNS
jgi:hypothetical protein